MASIGRERFAGVFGVWDFMISAFSWTLLASGLWPLGSRRSWVLGSARERGEAPCVVACCVLRVGTREDGNNMGIYMTGKGVNFHL